MRYLFIGLALAGLSACSPSVPDSAAGVVDTDRGVGFGNYSEYQAAREAELTGQSTVTTVPGPVDVQSGPIDPVQAAAENSGITPLDGPASNPAPPVANDRPAPQVVTNAVGISSENDFDAVSSERNIEADAALIASMVHYGTYTIEGIKQFLDSKGVPQRMHW